jgi:4-amino-4-deoxy-L-arabinose transferase-like glycosyltransferase
MIDPYNSEWEIWLQKWFIRLLLPAILVNAGGLLIPILEPDGALYATIAKTIARSGDFINLRVEGKDWLDKPHFPFWMAALSFRCLGFNAFAYKFPALLFWGAGAWYTYRLALSLYGKPIAQLSALIYVSAAHLVISNNDVRAEPYLTGLIIGSVYHFYKASRVRPGLHLVAGSLLAACAAMTKGPFVLITIGAGFILDWITGKEWEQFRNIRWYIAILLTAIFTLPEIYCLYVQFDLHPEKLVFGRTGVSGIRFFFWDSQFGRFFNTGPIKGSGDPFFYFHTLLWAFLPWSILLYAAIVQKCRRVDREGNSGWRRSVPGDNICLGAALASFIVFSLSRFQLPHYLNILFPFFSILTAGYLYGIRRKWTLKALRIIQGVVTVLLPILLLVLSWFFRFDHLPLLLTVLLLLSIAPFLIFRGRLLTTYIARSFWMAMLVFSFVNFILYPAILNYQSGTQAGNYIARRQDKILPVITRTTHDVSAGAPVVSYTPAYMLQEGPVNYSFEFYSPIPVVRIPMDSLKDLCARGPILLFAPTGFADTLLQKGYHTIKLQEFPNFHISQLTGQFVNYPTRPYALEWYSLLEVVHVYR